MSVSVLYQSNTTNTANRRGDAVVHVRASSTTDLRSLQQSSSASPHRSLRSHQRRHHQRITILPRTCRRRRIQSVTIVAAHNIVTLAVILVVIASVVVIQPNIDTMNKMSSLLPSSSFHIKKAAIKSTTAYPASAVMAMSLHGSVTHCRNGLRASSSLTTSCSEFVGKKWTFQRLQHRKRIAPTTARRRSLSTKGFIKRSVITMMPEGPEVRHLVDELQGGIGRRLYNINFVSGRYVRTTPVGFEAFAQSMTQDADTVTTNVIDTILEWNAKGKFIYILLDDESKQKNLVFNSTTAFDANTTVTSEDDGETGPFHTDDTSMDYDYQRSIWITLGMSGRFLSESALEQKRKENDTTSINNVRWYFELGNAAASDDDSMDGSQTSSRSAKNNTRIYYVDTRNFGTVRFSLSRSELQKKLNSLGPDLLSEHCTVDDFTAAIAKQRNPTTKNVCKFLMDQSNICGIGNYILAEGLYRSCIDPFAVLSELSDAQQTNLYHSMKSVITESYKSQGTNDDATFEYQCYGKSTCRQYNEPVIRETKGPHGRTIWYTDRQLFRPRQEREEEVEQLKQSKAEQQIQKKQQLRPIPQGTMEDETISNDVIAKGTGVAMNTQSVIVATPKVGVDSLATAKTPGNAKLAALLAQTPVEPISAAKIQSIPSLGLTPETIATASTPGNTKLAEILSSTSNSNTLKTNKQSSSMNRSNNRPSINTDFASAQIVETSTAVSKLLSTIKESSWHEALTDELSSSTSFSSLATFLAEQNNVAAIYPPRVDVFAALNACPLPNVKVIIIGQDPYHGPGQGHGLAFSVRRGVPAPRSLQNIILEAINDVGIEPPNHGNLEYWSKQGVLLLNTVLTVRQGEANSHAGKGWEEVTDTIIKNLCEYNNKNSDNDNNSGLVFLLWGNAAMKKANTVISRHSVSDSNPNGHVIIQTSHPSPLGATKTKSPFIGSKCFSRVNAALLEFGHDPIDWNLDE